MTVTLAELREKLVPKGTSDTVVIQTRLFIEHSKITAALNSLALRLRFVEMGIEYLKCTAPYCRGSQQKAKSTKRGAKRVSKMWKMYRRRLRRTNADRLRNGDYEHTLLWIPCTDGI